MKNSGTPTRSTSMLLVNPNNPPPRDTMLHGRLLQIERDSLECRIRHEVVVAYAHSIGISTAIAPDEHALTLREGVELLAQKRRAGR